MLDPVATPQDYVSQITDIDKKTAIENLREICLNNLPNGFQEQISYGMIGYVIPHTIYPAGYHCNPKLPLPFLNLAAQKNFVAIYHMGLYAMPELMDWFVESHKAYPKKLDMGKSCIRYKKAEDIPYPLIVELVKKVTPKKFIEVYESNFKK